MGDNVRSKHWGEVDATWGQLRNQNFRNLRRLKKKLNKAA